MDEESWHKLIKMMIATLSFDTFEFKHYPTKNLISVLKADCKPEFFMKHVHSECNNIASLLKNNGIYTNNNKTKEQISKLERLGVNYNKFIAFKIGLECMRDAKYTLPEIDKILSMYALEVLLEENKLKETLHRFR